MTKWKISVQELRWEITSGMTEAQIMEKYQLTSSQLQRLLRRMMVAGYLSELDLLNWLRLTDSQLMQVFRED